MKHCQAFFVLGILISLFSCAGRLPGVGILAPSSLVGYTMDAGGMKGSYTYQFIDDRSYQRTTFLPSGAVKGPDSGKYIWDRHSESTATLSLDGGEVVVELDFTTHEHANAKLKGEPRLYPVEFRAPKE